jgi:hypothetical protein
MRVSTPSRFPVQDELAPLSDSVDSSSDFESTPAPAVATPTLLALPDSHEDAGAGADAAPSPEQLQQPDHADA